MMKIFWCMAFGISLSLLTQVDAADDAKPHWGSLAAGRVLMRTGPGRNFPAIWEYHRQDLPVRVIQSYPNWRKITDPDGAAGWVQSNLLSDVRTALVIGDIQPLHQMPNASSPVIWRAEPGVVGKITTCGNGWCQIDAHGRMGYIETSALWGAD